MFACARTDGTPSPNRRYQDARPPRLSDSRANPNSRLMCRTAGAAILFRADRQFSPDEAILYSDCIATGAEGTPSGHERFGLAIWRSAQYLRDDRLGRLATLALIPVFSTGKLRKRQRLSADQMNQKLSERIPMHVPTAELFAALAKTEKILVSSNTGAKAEDV